MKITWLGQFALLIKTNNTTLMVDPYLTDSIADRLGADYSRLVPLREEYLSVKPDVILLSHDHTDHLDVPSLKQLLDTPKQAEILAGANAWTKARTEVGGHHNYIRMVPGSEWSTGDFHIRAVSAVHSDPTALGFVIHAEGLTLYLTGDSLYSREIIGQIGEPVDIMVTVVNGLGNNMNGTDAARLAAALQPKVTIPVHWGLFAKYADTPERFLQEANKRGAAARRAEIYEELDTRLLLEEFV